MFGMGQLAMMQKMKEATEQSKKRLDSVIVSGEAGGGLILVEMTGNRKLHKLEINADLAGMEKDDLEDLLAVALGKALQAANEVHDFEMANSARQFIPGM
jgi:DNA-binding YbaB/EbfC family protein